MNKDNINKIKFLLDNQYDKYQELASALGRKEKDVNSLLSIIRFSSDDDIAEKSFDCLVKSLLKEYKDLARETRRQWDIYRKLFDDYMKFKRLN